MSALRKIHFFFFLILPYYYQYDTNIGQARHLLFANRLGMFNLLERSLVSCSCHERTLKRLFDRLCRPGMRYARMWPSHPRRPIPVLGELMLILTENIAKDQKEEVLAHLPASSLKKDRQPLPLSRPKAPMIFNPVGPQGRSQAFSANYKHFLFTRFLEISALRWPSQ